MNWIALLFFVPAAIIAVIAFILLRRNTTSNTGSAAQRQPMMPPDIPPSALQGALPLKKVTGQLRSLSTEILSPTAPPKETANPYQLGRTEIFAPAPPKETANPYQPGRTEIFAPAPPKEMANPYQPGRTEIFAPAPTDPNEITHVESDVSQRLQAKIGQSNDSESTVISREALDGLPYLIVEGRPTETYPLTDNREFLVGRLTSCNLVIEDDPNIAQQHVRFGLRGGKVFVQTLSTVSPVLLNNRPLNSTSPVLHRDRISLSQNTTLVLFTQLDS